MKLRIAANISLLVNVILFILKAIVGIISNSIAVISEAVNSLTDIISSLAIRYSVYLSKQDPDEKHQFGHNAAQPLAAFIVAVFAFVVGIKIVETSIGRILNPEEVEINIPVYVVLFLTIITKIFLSLYQRRVGRKYNSPAMKAAAIDSLNDILASGIALLGVICTALGFMFVDGIAGIMVALFIFKTGYEVARENIDYLMGKSAEEELIFKIIKRAVFVEGVKGFNDIRSHYVGDKFHIEIHIEVDKSLPTGLSHEIGNKVKYSIQEIEEIHQVFVHIDPV
jgi:cation diffusion facilitator family transporter